MGATDRVALLYDSLDIRIESAPPRQPIPPGHVAISPKFCGICGSDLLIYFNKDMVESLKTAHPLTGQKLPITFGHEFAGIITEVGADCQPELAVGDRVAVMPTLTDGSCWSCINGSTNTCSQLGFIGYHGESGGMSDHAVVPAELALKLPPSVDCDIGALIEPLAVAWHALSLVTDGLTAATSVLIVGGGPVGAAILLCLKARGVTEIMVSDPSAEKRAFVRELGAASAYHPTEVAEEIAQLTARRGVDVAFDCAGVADTLGAAAHAVRPKGTVVNLALQPVASIPLLAMVMKEAVLKCSVAYTLQDFHEVLEAVEAGLLRPSRLITKRIRLEDVVDEGFVSLHRKDNKECKILVDLCK